MVRREGLQEGSDSSAACLRLLILFHADFRRTCSWLWGGGCCKEDFGFWWLQTPKHLGCLVARLVPWNDDLDKEDYAEVLLVSASVMGRVWKGSQRACTTKASRTF